MQLETWAGRDLGWVRHFSEPQPLCSAVKRTHVYVTGGHGSKHIPLRGWAGPGLAPSKLTKDREHRPAPSAQGQGCECDQDPQTRGNLHRNIRSEQANVLSPSGQRGGQEEAQSVGHSLASPPSALRTSSLSDSTCRPHAPSPTPTCFHLGVLGRPSPCLGSTSWTKLHSTSKPGVELVR